MTKTYVWKKGKKGNTHELTGSSSVEVDTKMLEIIKTKTNVVIIKVIND